MILFLVILSLVLIVALSIAVILLARLVLRTNGAIDEDLADLEMQISGLHMDGTPSAARKIQITLPVSGEVTPSDFQNILNLQFHQNVADAIENSAKELG